MKGLEKLWQLLQLLLEQGNIFQTYLHISKGKVSLSFLLRSLLVIFFSLYFVQLSDSSMKHYFALLHCGSSTSLKVWNFNQNQQRINSQMAIFFFLPSSLEGYSAKQETLYCKLFCLWNIFLREKRERGLFPIKNEHLTSEFSSFLFCLPLLCIFCCISKNIYGMVIKICGTLWKCTNHT